MRSDCLDIGIVQAFLDGETEPAVSLKVADHISECQACSAMLAEAEEESAIVFPLLEREFNTLVPTQRLWTKINDEIEFEKNNQPFWRKLWTGVAVALSNPSIAVAASVLVIFGVFVAFWGGRYERPQQVATTSGTLNRQVNQNLPVAPAIAPTSDSVASLPDSENSFASAPRAPRMQAQPADYRVPARTSVGSRTPVVKESAPIYEYIPGEESYVKTIASLNVSVADQKDVVMRPSERVSFERDMAVVNDSIKKMRDAVRKNPKNESAKQVLYTSYQNKIDLLNSVSQKEELLALK